MLVAINMLHKVGGVAHRGHLLEADGQAAARGVFDRLFGRVGEVVVVRDTVNEEGSG